MNSPKKMTAADFQLWRNANAPELEEARAQNQREVDDRVFQAIMNSLKNGMTLDAAGDLLLRNDNFFVIRNGIYITEDAVKWSLRSIGWKPKAERKKGG